MRSAKNTDDDEEEHLTSFRERYRESTVSDSGTEADDEHFLKGLPAPKPRPHKGLRAASGSLSGTPSPLLSPAVLDEDVYAIISQGRSPIPAAHLAEDDARKAWKKFRRKRRADVLRRATETALIFFAGAIVCRNKTVRPLLRIWKRGQLLLALYFSMS